MRPHFSRNGIQNTANILKNICRRPDNLTEVRRDGKDNLAVIKVIISEVNRCVNIMDQAEFLNHMNTYASSSWATMDSLHQQMLEDEKPENELIRLHPDHWYEINLTNARLFSNLNLHFMEDLEQLVPGRLFTTRMPRNIKEDIQAREMFAHTCKMNNLEVICILTEPHEFEIYSGIDWLPEFYEKYLGLTVYNPYFEDFGTPTSAALINKINDLTYNLSQGRNCLIHCAGGTGRTGMVVAAIVQNLGVYDALARIRRVKSTYVETAEQELFLKTMPKVIDNRIIEDKPHLARAIAAEQLIQVFHTHVSKIKKATDKDVARDDLGDMLEPLDQIEKDSLLEAYSNTFDLLDQQKAGVLDKEDFDEWFAMAGAEIDMSKIRKVLLGDKNESLTREKFVQLMSSTARPNRRNYDIEAINKDHQEE